MAVTSTVRSVEYAGDDLTTQFAFSFLVQDAADLVVTLRASDGTSTTQTLGTDYNIDSYSIGSPTGGSVTFVTAPTADLIVRLERTVALTQTRRFTYNGPFLPTEHEAALDRIVMMIHQLRDDMTAVSAQTIATVYTTATRPTASETLRGITIRVKDTGSPEYLQICLQLSDGASYGWATITVAPLE